MTTSANDGHRVMFCQRHWNAGSQDFDGLIEYGAFYNFALTEGDVEEEYTTHTQHIRMFSIVFFCFMADQIYYKIMIELIM